MFSATPLKCYVCDTSVTPDCGDPFKQEDNEFIGFEDCETDEYQSIKEETVCLKLTLIDHDENRMRTTRRCYQQIEDSCKMNHDDNIKFCEMCKTDGCNGSTQMKPFITFIIISILQSFWYKNSFFFVKV